MSIGTVVVGEVDHGLPAAQWVGSGAIAAAGRDHGSADYPGSADRRHHPWHPVHTLAFAYLALARVRQRAPSIDLQNSQP